MYNLFKFFTRLIDLDMNLHTTEYNILFRIKTLLIQ